jgi:N-acetylneuraminate synthase
MIEFHLDLDGQGEEFLMGHCWLPGPMEDVIRMVNLGLDADGQGDKVPAPCELPDREWRSDPADALRPMRTIREKWR